MRSQGYGRGGWIRPQAVGGGRVRERSGEGRLATEAKPPSRGGQSRGEVDCRELHAVGLGGTGVRRGGEADREPYPLLPSALPLLPLQGL